METDSHDAGRLPSDVFKKNFKNVFVPINAALPHICNEKYIRKQLRELIQDIEIDTMGCSEHYEDVEIKFKQQTVIFTILAFCKNVNDLLTAKNKYLAPECNFIEKMAFDFKNKKKHIGKYGAI